MNLRIMDISIQMNKTEETTYKGLQPLIEEKRIITFRFREMIMKLFLN
jgi:hypothetical protein